jgi:hypothetical protein
MIRLATLLLIGLLVWSGPSPLADHDGEAQAQIWRSKRSKRARKKRARRRARPRRAKKPERKTMEVEEIDEPEPSPSTSPPPSTSASPSDTTVAIGTDDDSDSLTIEDDLDTGPKVTFSKSELQGTVAGKAGVTQLETMVMAFARMGVDMIHDPVPTTGADGTTSVGEDVFGFRAHARAEGTSRFGKRMKVKVAGRVNADLTLDTDTHVGVERYEAEVWDTYVDFYAKRFDVRFGKQYISWGVADLLSPNDMINARDLRRGFAARPADLRLPTLATSVTAYDGPFSLQLLWVPVAPTNRFELLDGDYAMLGPNAPTPVERRVGSITASLAGDPMYGLAVRPILDIGAEPDNGLDTGELGARISLRFRKLDLHAYGFWGHERNPRIQVAPELQDLFVNTPPDMLTPDAIAAQINQLSMMGATAVKADYPRRLFLGGAIATRLEPVGVKLEAGYSPLANTVVVPQGLGPLLSESVALPRFAVAASVDYDRGSELNIILEANHTRVLDVPSNRSVFQFDGDQLTVVGTRMSWTPRRGPVTLRLLGFVDVTSPSYAIKPALRLSGHDNLSLELAAAIYGGPAGSFGGLADRNDEVLLTVQYGL